MTVVVASAASRHFLATCLTGGDIISLLALAWFVSMIILKFFLWRIDWLALVWSVPIPYLCMVFSGLIPPPLG